MQTNAYNAVDNLVTFWR